VTPSVLPKPRPFAPWISYSARAAGRRWRDEDGV
jgi:hypothetical protein